jgi:hypothetical protein
MRPIPFQVFIDPVIYRNAVDPQLVITSRETTLGALCHQAGITLRATVPHRTIFVVSGQKQIRTPHADIVSVPVSDLDSPEAALRALEALAHSFHDHGARACVCKRGLFVPPE